VSAFAVVPADNVPVTADTAGDDAGVNSGTAVGFGVGDTANNHQILHKSQEDSDNGNL